MVRREQGVWQVWRRRARVGRSTAGSRLLAGRGACGGGGTSARGPRGVWEAVSRRGVRSEVVPALRVGL